ncbi:MAG: hypothetical protein ACYC99_13105 [Candidatus Geothermincolia bacterium]
MLNINDTDRPGKHRRPATKEPVASNRRFYIFIILSCVIVVALSAAVATYKYAFITVEEPREPRFDLSSLFVQGAQKGLRIPDANNPCIVLQEHLDRLRRRDYGAAYKELSEGLRNKTSLADFTTNARKNEPLFRDVVSYNFPTCTISDNAATASGFIKYSGGGKSRVDAWFAKEGGKWKIALLALVYQ